MANRGRKNHWQRAMRRGVGLGLAAVAVWGVTMTADLSGVTEVLRTWADRPAVAVALLESQLGSLPEETVQRSLTGWNRLLVGQSALLSAGQDEVEDYLQGQQQEQQDSSDSSDPSTEPEEAPDDDDQVDTPLQPPVSQDGILEMTGVGKEGGQYLSQNGVYLYNRTGKNLDESVFSAGMVHFTLGEGPQILILHTHGSEAYSQSDGLTYQESDSYRTTDCTRNMVRVGEEMAQIFRENGFEVIHDTKDWLAKYPSIKIILDVHRDALVGNDGSIYKLVSQENGEKVAQVMLVVGTDGGGASHPYWIDNLALAIRYQQELISDYVTLARPIVLRNSRYNQNLSTGSLLVEVGGHGNTLTEALAGARLFAQSVSQVLLGIKE